MTNITNIKKLQAEKTAKELYKKIDPYYQQYQYDVVDAELKQAFEKHSMIDIIAVAANVGARYGDEQRDLMNSSPFSFVFEILKILENNHCDMQDRNIYNSVEVQSK